MIKSSTKCKRPNLNGEINSKRNIKNARKIVSPFHCWTPRFYARIGQERTHAVAHRVPQSICGRCELQVTVYARKCTDLDALCTHFGAL